MEEPNKKKIKTQICVPCMDSMSSLTTAALVEMDKTDARVVFNIGSIVGLAREQLAKKAVQNEVEWTLWVDSDMTFPPYVLPHMLSVAEKYNLDMLTEVCYMRRPPYSPNVFEKFEIHEDLTGDSFVMKEIPENALFEVAACGFAMFLVKEKVIEDVVEKFGNPFTMIGPTGEDLSFCWKARQCGYKIWADSTLKIGHVSQFVVDRDIHKAARS